MYSIKNFFKKLNHSKLLGLVRLRSNSNGQGVVELVLLLVIVIGVIFGSVYQLNTAFKSYADNYFGNYLACLLETGELPTLGAQQTGTAGICAGSFQEFSMKDGKKLAGGDSSSGSGSSSSSSGSIGSSSDADGRGDLNAGGSAGSVGGGGSTRSSDSGSGFMVSRRKPKSSGSAAKSAKKDKAKYTGDTSSTSVSWGVGGDEISVTQMENESYDSFDGSPEEQQDERKPMQAGSSTKKNRKGKSENRILVAKKQLKKQGFDDDEPFTFGSFIRYIIIICIILAILLFFGGQVLQFSKSRE